MEQGPRGALWGDAHPSAEAAEMRPGTRTGGPHPSRGWHSTSGKRSPTGKAGAGVGGRHIGDNGSAGARRSEALRPGPGTATRGSEPSSATAGGAGFACASVSSHGKGRPGTAGLNEQRGFGGPRGTAAPPRRPWHRAPSSANRKSLTTGRSIDPPTPPASGRQECPTRQASRRRAAGEPPGAPAR